MATGKSVFKDGALQAEFDKNGYVVLSLFTEEQIGQLNQLYDSSGITLAEGFSTSIHTANDELKAHISAGIKDIIQESVDSFFENYRSLGSGFLNKTPGERSYMPPHQDWTIVDESSYYSATIWIPLCDTDETNGTLRVLPQSHQFSDALRSPSILCRLSHIRDSIFTKTISLPLKKGQAVIFNHALIHASSPNISKANRRIATYGLVPATAQLRFYHQNGPVVDQYNVANDFFLTYKNIGAAPENVEVCKSFEYHIEPFTKNSFENILVKTRNRAMKRLFKDDEVQNFFNKNGYCKIQVLNEEQVKELLQYYYDEKFEDISGSGFSMSMEDENKEKVARVRKKIFEVALPTLLPQTDNAKVIAGSYVVKHPNPMGVVPPHQDWSFVDNEGEYYSVTCWIPLVDTKIENGCMGVIPGSHNLIGNLRPSPSPQVPTPLSNHVFSIFPYFKMYEMKAGEALIFDHRTFHGSTPNVTNQLRVAIGIGLTQADSTICHYTLKNDGQKNTLQKYYVDDDFLMTYNNLKLSKMYDRGEAITGYKVAEELPYNLPNYSLAELQKMFDDNGNVYDMKLVETLMKLFPTQQEEVKPEENHQPQPAMQDQQAQEPAAAGNTVETKPFWQVYTPLNIIREIANRISNN